ncbi:MAG: hypothetical protein J5524_05890 [Bacteroidaceae bacterium]|nr:hypothetical protein [Bacteroidaceae bacterium]
MKKIYCTPVSLVNEAEVQNIMAVSLMDGNADPNAEVLTKENSDWKIWEDED